ncbi:MAG TPA: diaminopimelate decarboxylase, partial [Candidatus Saccharimonadales bacterium]|nr:diaminopimelate decarboxylase [Candidatus Saccharimonadales bacterium]
MIKKLPFTKAQIKKIIFTYPTPFHIYDEEAIRKNARAIYKAFSWMPGYKNYFAVKALPNPYILKILKEEGMGTDCSSLPEIVLSEKVGLSGEDIMFTSNETRAKEYKYAKKAGAIINLDDISHIPYLEKEAGLPKIVGIRYNPGPARTGNKLIGNPKEAKFGVTKKQLIDGYKILKDKGVKRFGLHTMIVSNELDSQSFIDTASMLFDLVVDISKKLGIKFEFVNLGGGIGIPYKPDQKPVDLDFVSVGIKKAYDEKIVKNGLDPLRIVTECGRFVT